MCGGGISLPGLGNVSYIYRGLFFIVLSILWVLWERGSIKDISQLIGSFLIVYGIAIIGTHLLTMGYREREALP